jgi:membrane protein
MAFFALLSFVPMVVAVGAGLGYLERVIGAENVEQGQQAAVSALTLIFAGDVIAPLVRGLLEEQRGGVALGGLVVTVWLASRVFSATIRSLDLAYGVEERRSLLAQRGLALVFALGSVVVVAGTLGLVVVGPLLGGGQELARRLGFGEAFAWFWAAGRWPALLVIMVAYLAWVYRVGPNVRNTWRECLPGAVVGVGLWLLATVALRAYLAAGGQPAGTVTSDDEAVAAAAQLVGALVAAIVWVYLSSIAILVGGVVNAQLAIMRGRMDAVGG